MKPSISEQALIAAAQTGADALFDAIADALFDSIHGELNAESMQTLNSQQITLLAYKILRDEVMDGGSRKSYNI